jgi:hypothetical protein
MRIPPLAPLLLRCKRPSQLSASRIWQTTWRYACRYLIFTSLRERRAQAAVLLPLGEMVVLSISPHIVIRSIPYEVVYPENHGGGHDVHHKSITIEPNCITRSEGLLLSCPNEARSQSHSGPEGRATLPGLKRAPQERRSSTHGLLES